MAHALDKIYESEAAWKGPEVAASSDWIYRLTEDDVAEIDTALAHVKSKRMALSQFGRSDFPLPTLSKTLAGILTELETGRGFKLIRGIPVMRYSEEDATLVYWGLMSYFGESMAQNMMGELISHVRAIEGDWNQDFNIRGYQTTVHLPFHCDKADLVGLMCLQTSKAGGTSCISSAVAIHNQILRTRPDLLAALYEEFYIDHRGEEFEGDPPYYISPVFAIHKGQFFSRFGSKYVESAQRFPEVPRMTPTQTEGLAMFGDLAMSDEFRLDMEFERGDIQLLNNHYIVHSRTDYEDWPELDRRRHLLRMILLTKNYTDAPNFTLDLNSFIRRWGNEPRQSVLKMAN